MGAIAELVGLAGAPLGAADPRRPVDAIVVLGAPLDPTGALSPIAEERVVAGVAAFAAGLAPILCVTGGTHAPGGAGPREADAMAARAHALGVPRAAIVIEREARSTAENAALVRARLPDARVVALVTQRFHARRARRCFRRVGFEALVWPIVGGLAAAQPGSAARWIAREYAAWAWALLRR
jgi:uncharacterized SAM-binding protein YcdF (DUF218 family)